MEGPLVWHTDDEGRDDNPKVFPTQWMKGYARIDGRMFHRSCFYHHILTSPNPQPGSIFEHTRSDDEHGGNNGRFMGYSNDGFQRGCRHGDDNGPRRKHDRRPAAAAAITQSMALTATATADAQDGGRRANDGDERKQRNGNGNARRFVIRKHQHVNV